MGGGQGLVEVTKFEADFTLMDTCWVPSSPRLIALGSTLGGQGQIAVLSLSGLLSSLLKIGNLNEQDLGYRRCQEGEACEPCAAALSKVEFL